MRFLAGLVLLTLGLSTARADPVSFYFGAGITHDHLSGFGAEFNPQLADSYADISATSFKVLTGVRPLNWFAVEADYYSSAASTGSLGERSKAQAFAGYAEFLTGQEAPFEVFLKGGLSSYTLTSLQSGANCGFCSNDESHSGVGPAAGAGAQMRFGHVAVRLEFEDLFSLGKTSGLQVVSLSVLLTLP